MLLKRELVEQCSLFDLPMPHHDLQSCQLDRLNHCYLCVATDAFNRPFATYCSAARVWSLLFAGYPGRYYPYGGVAAGAAIGAAAAGACGYCNNGCYYDSYG
jgi:hypothetical protein